MIRIINGANRNDHSEELAAMHRLRKRVFHDLLKWEVKVEGDMEIDHYDDANPIYVLSYSPEGKLRGSLRLLPTLGPNMLDDTFPILLGDRAEIRSASIWESSRFCIEPEISQDRASNQVTIAAAELMCGVGELGLTSGLSHIVTVTDVFLERMFRRMGCPGERIGEPHKIGSVYAVAVAWEVTPDLLQRMKAVAEINGPVLAEPIALDQPRAA
ncbi:MULTISPECIES: acyl-homoserine-lactone synthase [Alphaproteobacteria]|uniref:Acyl-homoserine-lactone synthase n=2 Tax=Alphaproteobacteria TaxID=28211 RepID=A0A512HCF5_9HYPH|nr:MULTISPECIES: acyl-homoserine-lactone synthase [Alphaproteobacteria]GEO83136.1 acyl-homoserine-lactone synthase [Ciceribacter naphthalenivorans]GLR20469.1 acyl-homoserine-lactone synthase [Ciceribacter naphthalenivorans]GLT03325.1 acyl-homoserine-lactone synthase [Sphingomonas psychrolutea]